MNTRGMLGSVCAIVVLVALAAPSAHAQVVGDAAPVAEKQGLLGTYYRFTEAAPPGAPPDSPINPKGTTLTLLGEQLDPIINTDFVANRPPILTTSSDLFMTVWTGRVVIATAEAVTFSTASDDGERSWFVDVTKAVPDLNFWTQRGVVEDIAPAINLPVGMMPVRIEFEQGNGGAACYFRWQSPSIATKVIVPTASLRPPPGPVAPTLAATSPIGSGPAVVNLSWNQPAGATGYFVCRQTVAGAPAVAMQVLALINSGATVTYQDNAVVYGVQYSYIIQATSHTNVCIGPASNTQTLTPMQPWVAAVPNTGLQTSENLTTATFDIVFTQPAPPGGTTVTVLSNDIGEGTVAASGLQTTLLPTGFSFDIAAGVTPPPIAVIVTGVDDVQVDGAIAYTVSVTATNITGPQSPPVQLLNNDNDIQGLTFSRTAGVHTSESGGQGTFVVYLNREPFGNVSFSLTSDTVAEGTVLPGTLTFQPGSGAYQPASGIGGWNQPHTVTVTGVDDAVLDFTIPYTIITGALTFSDPQDQAAFATAGVTAVPDVACANFDNEVPPALPEVWGSAGCGLLGLEFAAPVLLAALLRRRRR